MTGPMRLDGAPVADAANTVTPLKAPVTELAAHGVELTKLLLKILTTSIILLVAYLWWLDSKTSDKVDQLYADAFSAIEARGGAPWQLNALHDTFDTLRQSPDKIFPKGAPERTQDNLRQVGDVLRLTEADIEALSACGALVKDAPTPSAPQAAALQTTAVAPPPSPAGEMPEPPAAQPAQQSPPAGAKPQSPVANADRQPAPAVAKPEPPVAIPDQKPAPVQKPPAVQDDKADASANLDRCVKLLEEKSFAAGGPLDTERVRLMRDFAKDMQENHQGLRTFWLSATQLILVNVLLPLLTALLGYIFGRQSASS